jgi:hypothetical protein
VTSSAFARWARSRTTWIAGGAAVALVVLLTVTLLATNTRPQRVKTASCSVELSLAPSCGAWWGSALNSTNTALPATVAAREAASDRRLDIVHTYHRWYDVFPTAAEQKLSASGHLLFLNWEPVDRAGTAMSWAAIAAGKHDTEIKALGVRLAALKTPVLLSFSHEPEENYQAHGGSASAFVAAFRHVHDLVVAAGGTNVRWVWNTMGLADPVWRARYPSLYPGNAYVDWIAWDPYNWGTCRSRGWQSFSQIATPFYQYLQASGFGDKPFMLAEYGSVEQSPGTAGGSKAAWLDAVPGALAALPNLKALVYFDLPAPPANCDWQLSTSTGAEAAYRKAATATPFADTAQLKLP